MTVHEASADRDHLPRLIDTWSSTSHDTGYIAARIPNASCDACDQVLAVVGEEHAESLAQLRKWNADLVRTVSV